MIEFVLGGARSGKSQYAEQQAIQSGHPVVYIATAEVGDPEMAQRIDLHRERRPQHWQTVEEPIKLAQVIQAYHNTSTYLLVDCLTLWLTNILFDRQGQVTQQQFEQQTQALLGTLSNFKGHILFVSNEVGLGIVPMNKMSRRFVDESGFLHQKIAQLSHKVVMLTAGLPQVLKS